MTTLYDPPSGWRYGFPREYQPLEGESLEQTLQRDGYPEAELEQGMAKYVRFWESSATEFCKNCGAGLGRHHRDGEGTCPKCHPKTESTTS